MKEKLTMAHVLTLSSVGRDISATLIYLEKDSKGIDVRRNIHCLHLSSTTTSQKNYVAHDPKLGDVVHALKVWWH